MVIWIYPLLMNFQKRIPIITKIVNEDRLESIYEFIKKEINDKRQLYIFPIIEESEKFIRGCKTSYENIKNNIFLIIKLDIHGK